MWGQVVFYHAACWDEGGLAAKLDTPDESGAEGKGRLLRGRVFHVVGIGCSGCGEPLREGDRILRVMAVAPEPPHFLHVRCARALGHA